MVTWKCDNCGATGTVKVPVSWTGRKIGTLVAADHRDVVSRRFENRGCWGPLTLEVHLGPKGVS